MCSIIYSYNNSSIWIMKGWNISGLSGRPFWRWLQKKENYNEENIIKRGCEKKKIKNFNQYTMGIYGVFCWFYTCFEQKRNPKIITITIAGLFSRKMIHIGNQIGFPIRHHVKASYIVVGLAEKFKSYKFHLVWRNNSNFFNLNQELHIVHESYHWERRPKTCCHPFCRTMSPILRWSNWAMTKT